MSTEGEISRYEKRLLLELEEIERRIRDLEVEKASIRRLLANARGRGEVARQVNRKNSVDRILVETIVVNALSEQQPLKSRILYQKVLGAVLSMNDSTFRSHLHRLKEKGIIINHKKTRGLWRLPDLNQPKK